MVSNTHSQPQILPGLKNHSRYITQIPSNVRLLVNSTTKVTSTSTQVRKENKQLETVPSLIPRPTFPSLECSKVSTGDSVMGFCYVRWGGSTYKPLCIY